MSCYNKRVKRFFGFPKYSSMTAVLFELGIQSCNTIICNCDFRFRDYVSCSANGVVCALSAVYT
jgi:hypothetical protein